MVTPNETPEMWMLWYLEVYYGFFELSCEV